MNWYDVLRDRLRPSRNRGTAERPGDVPVPRLTRTRTYSRLPRFSGSATETDGGRLSGVSPATVRLNQAFTPAQPIADLRRFAGREDLVERLIRTIEDRRMHVVIHGDRGLGKTSLLHILTILAREARYLVRYTSCSADSEFDDLFRRMTADIRLLYHREYDPTSPEAEKGWSLADTFGDRLLTPTSLSEACAKIAGTRVLLILDEFDRASSPTFRKAIAELIKNLSDRSARVQIVIGGVAGNLVELIEHIPSIQRNVLGISVGPMSEDDLNQIISNAQEIGGIRFDPGARQALLRAVNGSPYLVNLIGQQAGRTAIGRNTIDISAQDVQQAVSQVETELRSRLSAAATGQLAVIERTLSPEQLREVSGHAQHNFGRVPVGHAKALELLRRAGEEHWWDENGDFRFSDDGIPVIIWLANLSWAEK